MLSVDVYNTKGEKIREIDLSDAVFGCEVKPHLMHDVVIWQLAKRRAATAKTKSRSEVSGGGAKPWRQKGTGRARAGSNRSPLWKGGGVIFGPNGRKYTIRLPKKVRREALRSALSMKLGEDSLKVVESMDLDGIKTKGFIQVLEALGLKNTLVVMGKPTKEVMLSSRNVPFSKTLDVRGLNVYDVLRYKSMILDLDAVSWIEETLGK
ncbi:MAG TPA: 50S ribosomal protein L4 [Deltaproteobacteria bacterium]|nr:MAG: 50S ribosomal protein L4 [Deltaproteobacteria bacterium]HDM32317.1 50S ribosomal protein L4 [Deltaproteobacteria bacterium]